MTSGPARAGACARMVVEPHVAQEVQRATSTMNGVCPGDVPHGHEGHKSLPLQRDYSTASIESADDLRPYLSERHCGWLTS